MAHLPRGIVHAYLATSELHMKNVFGMTSEQTLQTAVRSVQQISDLAARRPATCDSSFRRRSSPTANPAFALEVCEAVFEAWGKASPEKPIILNLPATVERRPPNQYADLIELFCPAVQPHPTRRSSRCTATTTRAWPWRRPRWRCWRAGRALRERSSATASGRATLTLS